MRSPTARQTCLSLAAAVMTAATAAAQNPCCPQPVTALSPVTAPAPMVLQPAPGQVVVPQATLISDPWYPGKWIGRVLSFPFRPRTAVVAPVGAPVVAARPTFTTAAYRPTFPPSYTTFAGVQSVARPVVLAPAPTVTASPIYTDPCNACGGVTTARFDTRPITGCGSCAGTTLGSQPYQGSTQPPVEFQGQPTPAPRLPADAPVSERRVNRRESPADKPAASGGAGADAEAGETSWFDPPQLFDPRGRSARRSASPPGNVRNAVYHGRQDPLPTGRWQAAYRPTHAPATGVVRQARSAATGPQRNVQVGVGGWRSAD